VNSLSSKMALRFYRGLGNVLYPFMGPVLRARARRGKEDRSRRYERYGYPSADKPAGPIIWVHAASVGESLVVLPLIEHMSSLGLSTIMTTGTVTSAQMVRSRLSKGAYHQYVPLDLKPALVRFLDHWQPDVAIFTESDIWPMTILELTQRHIPRLLVNARMSDRSFSRWKGAPSVADALFENFSLVIAQSDQDAERFLELGARPVKVSGNMKVDNETVEVDETELARFRKIIGERPVWAAVSTHAGEENACGRIHTRLVPAFSDILTIIVPRHPDRADQIAEELRYTGLKVARRSAKELPSSDMDIYLADTIGEMGLFLRLANVAFVGKSLLAKGGQNPLEPAHTGTAIVSGRNVQNFRDSYSKLLEAGAVRLVSDENMLSANVEYLLSNREEREQMVKAATQTLEEMRGARKRTLALLDAYLFPLTVKRSLEEINT